ncbi:PHP domain-containing protein [Halegenticoccus tardaugens]|uniref:PHP domain-containing protein n=1 Tax=Halegenticoccus tardaugens TaxID=2071624 RepID=UPI00100C1B55|nr:PHP domain-containing protein [Halegenticoccus tardaugens]
MDDTDPPPVADLHVHTTASDGRLTLSEVPAAARTAGIDSVAITDHDRVHPGLDAPVRRLDGVTVVRGIELRVDAGERGAGEVDLLGYGVRRTAALATELDRIQRNRVERGREIVARVEAHLGVDLDVEAREGIGRPHVARAVEASDAPYDYQDAFDDLIGDDGPCYVPRRIPSFERGVKLLSEACSVVSLAHPFRYADPDAALALTAHLDAVERYYPYERPVDPGPIDAIIEEHGLLATGGSDAHGRTLGLAGPPADAFEAFEARLPRP